GSASNPLTLDLSPYLDPALGAGMDPQDPKFTNKVFGRSLLREGASLALTQLTEKELVFPLYLGPVGGVASAPVNTSSLMTLIQQINQCIESPGFTASWQPERRVTADDLRRNHGAARRQFRLLAGAAALGARNPAPVHPAARPCRVAK